MAERLADVAAIAAFAVLVLLTAYAVLFPFWALLRRLTAGLDVSRYGALTKADWSLDWSEKGATTPATAGYQGHAPG